MFKMRKVVIVGAGHVGSHVALNLVQSGEADDIVLIDILREKAAGIWTMRFLPPCAIRMQRCEPGPTKS